MIEFHRRVLSNGLRVLVHEDLGSPMCAVNVLYQVGSRDEDENRTGFAHLFEHLMFGGSKNAPSFDEPLQNAGGDNNAFTNSDFTNFYDVIPAENVETALWLEADRMQDLIISSEALEVQRKVVLEEYAETCLNPPFGLTWHHLSGMVYEKHPYRWPTIGLRREHIADASLDDVAKFFNQWYGPNNAVICLAGGLEADKAFSLVEKYFGDIGQRTFARKRYPQDSVQNAVKVHHSDREAPIDALYLAFRGVAKSDPDFYAMDLLSDVFSGGRSARFFKNLVQGQRILSSADAYISGTVDPGMFVIEAKPSEGVSLEQAEKAIWQEIDTLLQDGLDDGELQRQVNKVESQLKFSEISNLHKAMSLCFHESMGDANEINQEMAKYHNVSADSMLNLGARLLQENSCSKLYYHKKI